jgi:preprotein translocase SecF subunit
MTELSKDFGKVKDLGSDSIGPVMGKELTNKAVIAIILSSIGILIYMAFRFEFKPAVDAVVALLHDVGMLIGIFALLQRQIDSSFVAAVLTVIGYSVNDTIVLFDRVRENMHMKKKESFEELVNNSINQTMARSINTGFGTLLTIVVLLLIGAPNTKDFLLAMLLGIICGTYSSLFIASPIWVMWKGWSDKRHNRDDAAVLVDHLDDELRPADGGVECAGRSQQGGSRRAQLRDLYGARSQGVIERAVKMPRDEHADDRADGDEGDQDAGGGREHRAKQQRMARHRVSTKPTPLTVWISGGSPSLRRR